MLSHFLARNLFPLWMLLIGFTAGCESRHTQNVVQPPKNPAVTNEPDEPEHDILPPQSEPPLADAKAKDEPTTNEDSAPTEIPESKAYVLFDGKALDHWKRSNFGGEGEVEVVDGAIVMQRGADLTGIHWTGDPLPKINYEITLEAQRVDGSDFFCGIVFPYRDEFCSFVAGGWGGSTIGLSSVDGMYAAENETGTFASFEDKTWYKFRLKVSEHAVTAWIDGKEYVHLKTKGRKLSLHPFMEPAKPLGLSCYATVASVKDVQLRELTAKEIAADEPAEE